jgi:hypothetical protein
MDDVVGSLTPGKAADFAAFEATTPDPLRELLEHDALLQRLWVGGAATPSPRSTGKRE